MWRCAEIWPVEHKPFRHSTMRSGSSSSSSRFKIHPKQVNASTCDFDWCCLQSGDNTGTHLHVSRKAICRPKQQLHVSTSMESPMSFVSRLWMFLIPSVTRFWCETPVIGLNFVDIYYRRGTLPQFLLPFLEKARNAIQ